MNKIAENAVFLIVVSYLLFLIIGLFFAEPFFRSQTDIEEIIVYGKQYLTICCCLSFGIFTQLMFERMLQATGKTIYTMYQVLQKGNLLPPYHNISSEVPSHLP